MRSVPRIMLSREEAADSIGVARATFSRMVARGLMPKPRQLMQQGKSEGGERPSGEPTPRATPGA